MGTGWRRAFCTFQRDPKAAAAPEQGSSRKEAKSAVVYSGDGNSNASTPRLLCRTAPPARTSEQPLLSTALEKTTGWRLKDDDFAGPYTPPPATSAIGVKGSPRLLLTRSSPASPRSPSRFALLKATLRLSRSRCGICSQSVRSGQRSALFTAECSHSFHFPCISAHVRSLGRSHGGSLVCPVCSASWRDVPLIASVPSPAAPPRQPHFVDSTAIPGRGRSGEAVIRHKIYDDDEPLLLSPSGHGGGALHFNPIPEADHEEEAEGCRAEIAGVDGGLEVAVLPKSAMVSSNRSHQSFVVIVKVKAPGLPRRLTPAVDPSCRAPMDLVTVLDVTGSMSPAKLLMLKKAMKLLVSSLGPADRLSIVAFSATAAKRLLPLVRMSRQGQRSARQIVDRLIVCSAAADGGGVSGDALRKATKVLEDRRERNPVATIVLLSDGHQNQQQSNEQLEEEDDAERLLRTRFAHLEIPVAGTGEATQAEEIFSRRVSGLVSVVLQDVQLRLTFPSGDVAAVYSSGGGGAVHHGECNASGISIRLGDLYAEEERELLLELRLAAPPLPSATMSYKCCYRDPMSRTLVICGEEKLVLPPLLQPGAQDLRNLFVTTRALVEFRRRRIQPPPSRYRASEHGGGVAGGEPLTPRSAWRAAEQLAKVAILKKTMNRVGDLHGFENARF
ncbi:hypothetical protein AXF42_Ash007796 [Apostasia shenzhenica]|uniref:Uncharacterized protein n=1 Tax=Apostasia shenzhenica TaxID=1088818 RepID=A0A2I0B5D2_9ASPA|nr:hypothetical protein AXF42_Ash007796 [Apostasia shenzhenica]